MFISYAAKLIEINQNIKGISFTKIKSYVLEILNESEYKAYNYNGKK